MKKIIFTSILIAFFCGLLSIPAQAKPLDPSKYDELRQALDSMCSNEQCKGENHNRAKDIIADNKNAEIFVYDLLINDPNIGEAINANAAGPLYDKMVKIKNFARAAELNVKEDTSLTEFFTSYNNIAQNAVLGGATASFDLTTNVADPAGNADKDFAKTVSKSIAQNISTPPEYYFLEDLPIKVYTVTFLIAFIWLLIESGIDLTQLMRAGESLDFKIAIRSYIIKTLVTFLVLILAIIPLTSIPIATLNLVNGAFTKAITGSSQCKVVYQYSDYQYYNDPICPKWKADNSPCFTRPESLTCSYISMSVRDLTQKMLNLNLSEVKNIKDNPISAAGQMLWSSVQRAGNGIGNFGFNSTNYLVIYLISLRFAYPIIEIFILWMISPLLIAFGDIKTWFNFMKQRYTVLFLSNIIIVLLANICFMVATSDLNFIAKNVWFIIAIGMMYILPVVLSNYLNINIGWAFQGSKVGVSAVGDKFYKVARALGLKKRKR